MMNTSIVVKNRAQGKSDLMKNARMRLFFALWPPEEVRDGMMAPARECHRRYGGRLMRPDSVHLTLLFIGEVPAEQLALLTAAASRVQTASFDLCIDQLACWKHNGIGFAASSQPPPMLDALATQLRNAVADQGVAHDNRKFTTHITLLRKLERAFQVQPIPPVHWPVREFVLMQSVPRDGGRSYEILGRWPLA